MEETKETAKHIGIGVSPGIALAPAVVYRPNVIQPPLYAISEDAAEKEWERLLAAKDITRRQLRELHDEFTLEATKGEAGIIDAHLMVLDDEMIVEDTRHEIFDNLHNCEWAVRDVANKYISQFNSFNDVVFSERANDIADVSRRLMRALMGITEGLNFGWTQPSIVVAENLTPSETLSLPRNFVKGVALDHGSMTSHAALLIRAVGIPAVFGLGKFSSSVKAGSLVAIDGNKGFAVCNPTAEEVDELRGKEIERNGLLQVLNEQCREPAVTPDGFKVKCFANIENVSNLDLVDQYGGEGIGLFRTEYLWLEGGKPVDEETQTHIYAKAAHAMGGRPFIVRAFDLGGDKFLPGATLREKEANPFLGLRSIRFLLQNEDLFKVQIRAILRAGALTDKQIHFLIPMVSDLSEVIRTRHIVEECIEELTEKGIPNCVMPKFGIMIEVPSAALISPVLAQHVDFFSIGSNDLTQYAMAADRINDSVAYLNQPLHPGVLRLISMTAEAAQNAKIKLCVCGEMARNPLHAIVLLGMRISDFSMSASSIPLFKGFIRRIPFEEAQKVAAASLNAATMAQVRHLSRDLLAQYAPEILRQC